MFSIFQRPNSSNKCYSLQKYIIETEGKNAKMNDIGKKAPPKFYFPSDIRFRIHLVEKATDLKKLHFH